MNILIITPLQAEYDPLLQGFTDAGYTTESGQRGRLSVTQLSKLNISIAIGGLGKTQFAIQTQHLLDHGDKPDVVICAGAAGALDDDLAVGDVVVGTTTFEHDFNNRFSNRPKPRFDASPDIIAALQSASTHISSFKTHFGIIASGDEDIVSADRRDAVRTLSAALVAAWEGAGGARACRFSDVPFVEIRGITDTANEDAPDHFLQNLSIAMHNIAALVIAMQTT